MIELTKAKLSLLSYTILQSACARRRLTRLKKLIVSFSPHFSKGTDKKVESLSHFLFQNVVLLITDAEIRPAKVMTMPNSNNMTTIRRLERMKPTHFSNQHSPTTLEMELLNLFIT